MITYAFEEILEVRTLTHPSHLQLQLAKLNDPKTPPQYIADWLQTLCTAVIQYLKPSAQSAIQGASSMGSYKRFLGLCIRNGPVEALMRHCKSPSTNTYTSKFNALDIWKDLLNIQALDLKLELSLHDASDGLEPLCKSALTGVRIERSRCRWYNI